MIEVQLEKILDMAGSANGSIDHIYYHWTAGRYNQYFDDYHINISGDGKILVPDYDLTIKRSHTWKRNSRAIGIGLCCCYDANMSANGLPTGEYVPTDKQIELSCHVGAYLLRGLDLSPDCIMTHAEAALQDGYGPYSGDPETRWDLYKLKDFDGSIIDGGNLIRGKVQWYLEHGN